MFQRHSTLISLAALLALVLAMFGDVLFVGGTIVLGDRGADLFLQYYSWRDFGFHELAKGNLALWNPYIFGGAPFFGGMQSALLYPPNWLFLILPLAPSINWTVALNIFLLGAFMFFWMRVRGLSAVASFFAGAIVMFSGPHFLHVFGGHLPQMAAMTWSPLIFCAIDGIFVASASCRWDMGWKPMPQFNWSLLGMLAVAMQIFAGFPQYVFYTAIIAGLYAGLRLIVEWNWRSALGLLSIYLGGAALTSVQLLPAIAATRETVRGVRVPFEFAAQCAFPQENFITLIAPNFFGSVSKYWGRCYLWETSLFLSVSAFVLAVYAAIYLERKQKWIPLIVAAIALWLALGANTPLFRVLYEHAPGFDRFRALAKFIFPASLFVVLLAASGLDRLLEQRKIERRFVAAIFVAALVIAIAGVCILETNFWQSVLNWMQATHETTLRADLFTNAEFIRKTKQFATISILVAAGILAWIGGLLAFVRRNPRFLYGVVGIAVIEIFVFARFTRATFDSAIIVNPGEKSFLAEHPGDYRIINPYNPNTAMSLRVPDIWGYDPNVVRRYAEFITWTQGGDPNNATLYVKFTRFDPLYTMLRLGYVIGHHGDEIETAEAPVTSMPHLQLISNYRVIHGPKIFGSDSAHRDQIFDAMHAYDFDPKREVILEWEPDPKPLPNDNPGAANIVQESTDALTIEADVNQPSILLITDVYAPEWRAVSFSGSVQSKYEVMPANYFLRAVPLAAGHHRFKVEYAPREFTIGKWISIVSLILFLASGMRILRIRSVRKRTD
jgi:hypothetical protein